jgi:hypothetical protein
VGRKTGGSALLVLALFMLAGFFRSGAPIAAPATIAALLLTVVLPAGAGWALLAGPARDREQLLRARERLRELTFEAETLRLAAAREGRLTAVEVAAEFAVSIEEAAALLTSFDTRGIAEVQITPSGTLVYSFGDVCNLGEKAAARGVLDA